MSDSWEETGSIIFSSLKHPARCKILRLPREKPKNFFRILKELDISGSHLNYHLENFGELGAYRTSSSG